MARTMRQFKNKPSAGDFNYRQRAFQKVAKNKRVAGFARGRFADADEGKFVGAGMGEKKNIDVVNLTSITAGSGAAALKHLNPLAPGTSATTRIGRRVKMHSLLIKWQGSLGPTSAGASPLRLLVVYDKQANGAAPAATDVLTSDAIASGMNLSNSRRFIILCNEEISCVGTQGPQSFMTERFIKMNLDVEFNTGVAGDITDIQTGSVYSLIYQNGNIITAGIGMECFTRIRFTDA